MSGPTNGVTGRRLQCWCDSYSLVVQVDQIDIDIESLPQEVLDRFPEEVEKLRTGATDKISEEVIDALPADVVDRIPESLLASGVSTTFIVVLAIIAGLALMGFLWGVMRAAIKAAVFFLILAVIAGLVLYWQV